MKKLLKLLFALVLTTTLLTACGGSQSTDVDPVVGVWKLSEAEAAGQKISLEEYQKMTNTTEVPTYEFTEDHKVKSSGFGMVTVDSKWEVKGDDYLVTDPDGTQADVTLESGKLKFSVMDVTLTFEKE